MPGGVIRQVDEEAEVKPFEWPTGEHKLAARVLGQAIDDLQSRKKAIQASALAWIATIDDRMGRYPFSFARVCQTLNLDVSAARKSLLRRAMARRFGGKLEPRSQPSHDARG